MCSEVVHEQVVCVVNEEVESVDVAPLVVEVLHLYGLLNQLLDLLLCSLLILYQLHTLLLLLLLQEVSGFFQHLLTLFANPLNFLSLV